MQKECRDFQAFSLCGRHTHGPRGARSPAQTVNVSNKCQSKIFAFFRISLSLEHRRKDQAKNIKNGKLKLLVVFPLAHPQSVSNRHCCRRK